MKNLLTFGVLAAGCVLAGLLMNGASAQTKGKGPGILQKEWGQVTGGSYSAPMGKLGEKPAAPWSSTTIGAAINGKPNPGKAVTVVGEILDFSCYLQVGKHGEKHRSCAQKCFSSGQPIGLLAANGTMYMLMEEEHDPRRDGMTDFRKTAIEHAAHIMEVSGTESQHGGYKALYVQGYLKK
ncbi:MAG: hypothetical protein IANPNBLG_01498 [Bryobacteraceae bacterium]|nr:hypothetical protein [Bryobacteraceae bacterium]MCC6344289.1 hypothetical protein [Bryobacterales bacterium]